MRQVVEFYHERLLKTPDALAYLASFLTYRLASALAA